MEKRQICFLLYVSHNLFLVQVSTDLDLVCWLNASAFLIYSIPFKLDMQRQRVYNYMIIIKKGSNAGIFL